MNRNMTFFAFAGRGADFRSQRIGRLRKTFPDEKMLESDQADPIRALLQKVTPGLQAREFLVGHGLLPGNELIEVQQDAGDSDPCGCVQRIQSKFSCCEASMLWPHRLFR